MNKSLLVGAVAGAATVAAVALSAHFIPRISEPEFAEITAIEAVKKTSRTPVEHCETVAVVKQRPVQDEHKIAGTALGATIGGALGNQVGGGSGKKIATVVGAVAGGIAGNQVQGNMQASDTYVVNEQRCSTRYQEKTRIIGYDVHYRLGDTTGTLRSDTQPAGNRLPVKDGVVSLPQP